MAAPSRAGVKLPAAADTGTVRLRMGAPVATFHNRVS